MGALESSTETVHAEALLRASWPPSFVPNGASPLRLLHVITRLGVGGIELGLQSLIEGLSPRVFEQRILPVRGSDEELGPLSSLAKFVLDSEDPAGGRSFWALLKAM